MSLKKYFLFITAIFLFNLGFAGDFYWVGNSGTWNDATHWSNTSGGNGGIGIPTLNDNVIIDENSFKKHGEITINGTASCSTFISSTKKNFTLSSGISSNLIIANNFIVNDKYTNSFLGKITFTSSSNSEINAGDSQFYGDVEFNGTGTWNLKSNLFLQESSSLFFNQGTLIANNKTILTGAFEINPSKIQKLDLTKSNFHAVNKFDLKNSTSFDLVSNQSNIFINRHADQANINISNLSKTLFTFGESTVMKTCGDMGLAVTATVLSDYNTYGVSCDGVCDGIAYVTITGGVGPFLVNWVGYGTLNDPDTLYNACQGNVGVEVTDQGQNPPFGSQCSDQILISNPIELTLNVIGTIDPTCFGDCDGGIGTSISFGVTPYNITWSGAGTTPADTTSSILNKCNGVYDLTVIDANGCQIDSSFNIVEPPQVSFDLDSIGINCFGDCSGQALVTNVAGGNGTPYTYLWDDPSAQVTPTASNLCAGFVTVTVSDPQNCSATDSIEIIEPLAMTFTSSTQDVSCGGLCDGSITATVTGGGVPPFTHNWSNGTVDVGASSTIGALCF